MSFFEHDFSVGFRDTGKSNTLTNKAFLSFMEDAGGLHSESAGFGMNEIKTTNLSWILLGWKLKVLSRPIYGTKLKVITWGRKFSKVHAFRDFEVYDDKNNLIAIATSKWLLFNIKENKIARITPEIIESYSIEKKSVFPLDKVNFSIENEPNNVLNTFDYTILRNNIDINNHMHNLCYLDIAYEALPEDVYRNTNFDNVEIIYKKECYLYDKIKCEYYFDNNIHYIYIKSLDNSVLHAVIKLY